MRARDLAEPAPVVEVGAPADAGLATLARSGLPGLVVRDGDSFVVVPASQALRVALPRYVLDDASLGRVWDERSADALAARLRERTVADLVAALDRPVRRAWVDGDATTVEIAAVMAAGRLPLVAVLDAGAFLGVVTVHGLLDRLLA